MLLTLAYLLVALEAAASAHSFKEPRQYSSNITLPVNQTTCNGAQYIYNALAGYGFVPSNTTDKSGDTIGGIGSSIAVDRSSWQKTSAGSYTGIVYALPDRGWNTQGTLNFQSRVHKFQLDLTPISNATVSQPAANNIHLTYLDTIYFSGPDGNPTTGIDGDPTGHLTYAGLPGLPPGTWTGDGFGRNGTGGTAVTTDTEGVVLNEDGSFWISDEYGPYIYHFSPTGAMVEAIRPPDATIPMRNGTESFSADSPPEYVPAESDDVVPADPDTGRVNNHGLEGLTKSADGKHIFALMQGALQQEGGAGSSTQRYVRLLQYDVSSSPAQYEAEYVVPLPLYASGNKKKTALQSEIHYLSPTQFLVLARDSGAGHGQSSSQSLYRHADVFDISAATDIKGDAYDCASCRIATVDGVLNSSITPATYCAFLDYNVNAQLNRFGLHNGGAQDVGLLNEKWESLALVPIDGDEGSDGEWFLLSFSDNDFITQDGRLDHGTFGYQDASGYDLDNQVLAFHISLPSGSTPS